MPQIKKIEAYDILLAKRTGVIIIFEQVAELDKYINNNSLDYIINDDKQIVFGEGDETILIGDLKEAAFDTIEENSFFMIYENVNGDISRCTACTMKKLPL